MNCPNCGHPMKDHSLGADRLVCFTCSCEVSTKMVIVKAEEIETYKDKLESENISLRLEVEQALHILKPLAYKKNVEDVNYFDLVAVTHFVEEHTEAMR